MRIGTFLLGGIVGAATVIYLSDKQNRSMMFQAIANPDSLGKMLNKTKDKAMDTIMNATIGAGLGGKSGSSASAFNSGAGASSSSPMSTTTTTSFTSTAPRTNSASPASMNASSGSSQGGLDQVQNIVNQDPELKRTVNEILSDSGKTGATLQ
ncbi:hypothetical protein ACFFK0_21000 [Paenibacillus chartarius]|uniref:Uncharacterized protein n=1 Tax=Paenibacillus chartarius TaxID=747481 RepID=A0ABV6DQF9_9BACL